MPPVHSNPVLAVTPRGSSPLVPLSLLRLPVGIADSRLQRLGSSALLTAIKYASFPMTLLHSFLDRDQLRRSIRIISYFQVLQTEFLAPACVRIIGQMILASPTNRFLSRAETQRRGAGAMPLIGSADARRSTPRDRGRTRAPLRLRRVWRCLDSPRLGMGGSKRNAAYSPRV